MNLVELYSDSSMLLDLQACDKQSANKEMLEYLVDQGRLQKAERSVTVPDANHQ